MRKAGGRVRITAQLIDATTGGHLWAERFDRDLTDIFAVQDDVTTKIVSALALNLSVRDRQSIAAEHTDNLEAYDCFLRGRELFWRHVRGANCEAEALMRRAADLDPGFAPACAFLASALVIDFASGWSPSPEQRLDEADKAARQAVLLDERYPYALWALAMSCLWSRRHEEAVSVAEKAIAFNPNFAAGYSVLGVVLHYAGRSEEALKRFERAVALDPYCPSLWMHFLAQANYQLGRYSETVSLLKRRILRNPETDASRALLAAAYGQMGLLEEAREAWRGLMQVNPNYLHRAAPQGAALQEPGRFRAGRRGPAQGRAAGSVRAQARLASVTHGPASGARWTPGPRPPRRDAFNASFATASMNAAAHSMTLDASADRTCSSL